MSEKIQHLKIEAYTEKAFIKAMKRLRAQGYEIKLSVYIHKTAKEAGPLRVANPSMVTLSLNRNDTCPVCENKACICSQPQMK